MVQRELLTLGTFLQIQTHSSGKAPVTIPPLKQTNKQTFNETYRNYLNDLSSSDLISLPQGHSLVLINIGTERIGFLEMGTICNHSTWVTTLVWEFSNLLGYLCFLLFPPLSYYKKIRKLYFQKVLRFLFFILTCLHLTKCLHLFTFGICLDKHQMSPLSKNKVIDPYFIEHLGIVHLKKFPSFP